MRSFFLALSVAGLLASCASPQRAVAAPDAVTFVVVRHAEKAGGQEDPELTVEGRARAERLARSLAAQPLVAAYATAYRRTRQTASPAAAHHGLDVTGYDAKAPATTVADMLLTRHRSGTVLVVGHSNTAPDIAAALCRCAVEPMPESEYGRRMVVTVRGDGVATLDVSTSP